MTSRNTDSGYVKLWRSFEKSVVFKNMPYCQAKLWLWLMMEASHKGNAKERGVRPGQVDHSIRFTVDAMGWIDRVTKRFRRPSNNTIKRDLEWFKDEEMITLETIPGVGTVITICNWDTYQSKCDDDSITDSITDSSTDSNKTKNTKNTEKVGDSAIATSPTLDGGSPKEKKEEQPEEKKSTPSWKTKIADLTDAHPQSLSLLKAEWLAHAPLPQSTTNSPRAKFVVLDTITKLHTIDKLSWDRIGTLLRYASQVSHPQGMIASPAKLRKLTKDGTQMTWEAIEMAMKTDKNRPRQPREARGMVIPNAKTQPTAEEAELFRKANYS